MNLKQSLSLFLLIACPLLTFGQVLNIASIFKPGVRVGYTFQPTTSIAEGTDFGMERWQVNLIIPGKTEAEVNIKKLNAGFRQHFFTFNGGLRQIESGNVASDLQVANFALGVTGIKAGIRRGAWAYSLNAGVLQDVNADPFATAYFVGGFARFRIRGIHRQSALGVAMAADGNRLLVFPVLGIRRRLVPRLHLNLLLPVSAGATFRAADNLRFDVSTGFTSLRAGLAVDSANSAFNPTPDILSWTALTTSVKAKVRFSSNMLLVLSAGVHQRTKLEFNRSDAQSITFEGQQLPYVKAEVRINFGKSPLGSQLFGNDF